MVSGGVGPGGRALRHYSPAVASLSDLSVGERVRLYGRTARRSVRRHGVRPWAAVGKLDPAPVFVVGCPRSGTTFTAESIGAVPGFFDLGEVNRLKASIAPLHRAAQAGQRAEVVDELRRMLRRAQRAAFVGGARAVEQTPESTFLIPELAAAFPEAQFVHLVRDGRDVAASLLERGWLAGRRAASVDGHLTSRDDAGQRFGEHARFWVEAGREDEFERSSDARRCAWAWRRYESAAASHLAELDAERVATVRYEELAADAGAVAARLGRSLGSSRPEAFTGAFSAMHGGSVGRYRDALAPDQLADVVAEAGDLLHDLGYAT